MPNAAYVLSGSLTVEKKSPGQKKTLHEGDVLAETVNIMHRGYTGKQGAVLMAY
jgi:quercetin dioxygenase-like cupin family protein